MSLPELILSKLVNRTDVYAEQQSDKSYRIVKQPLTRSVVEDHIEGNRTVGTYLLTPEGNTVKVGVFDFDPDHIDDPTVALREVADTVLAKMVLPRHGFLAEASRYDDPSYHAWLVGSTPLPAKFMRYLMQRILERADLDEGTKHAIELFPKQVELDEHRPYGNLIKLPCGFHRYKKKWSKLLDPETLEPVSPLVLEHIFGLSFPEREIYRVMGIPKERHSGGNVKTKRRNLSSRKEEAHAKFLARYWLSGYRNEVELSFLGMCIKRGVKKESAKRVIARVCELTGTTSLDREKALDKVEYHYTQRASLGSALKGYRGLLNIIKEMKLRGIVA